MKEWNEVLDLYKQAQQSGLNPGYGAEYIPFIEAFAQTGDWQKAYDLTVAADKLTLRHKRILCNTWERLAKIPSADKTMYERIDQNLSC
jgi:hypothetical protein